MNNPTNRSSQRQRKLYCLGCEERFHETLNDIPTPHRINDRITIWAHHPRGYISLPKSGCGPLVDIGI